MIPAEGLARGGMVTISKHQFMTVKVRKVGELTEYWEPKGSYWVPVITADQIKRYGAQALAALNEEVTK